MSGCEGVAVGNSMDWLEAGTHPPITNTLRMSANPKVNSLLVILNLLGLGLKCPRLAVPVKDELKTKKVPVFCRAA